MANTVADICDDVSFSGAVMANSVADIIDDASMPSIRRPKRRAGRRLLITAWTTLLFFFSHAMKAFLLLFRLLQHLGLLRILISDCAQNVLQHFGDLRILVTVRAKNVLQHLRLLRSFRSVCAQKILQHSGLYHNLVSIVLQHLELISICRKNVLQHLGLLRILISVCAQKVLQRLRLLRNLISVCKKKVLQHLGLLCIFISIRAKKLLQKLGDLRFLKSTCDKNVLQHCVVQPKQNDPLPPEVKGLILELLDYEQVFQLKLVSKDIKLLIESEEYSSILSSKKRPSFTACYFTIKNGVGELGGFDPKCSNETSVGKWRRLPPLPFLPDFDPKIGKQFLICANNGLVCINFSKSERFIVFNPLTPIWRELPPLLNRRNPILMHMIVDESTHSYQILVAGSSSVGQEHLSKITELYDSRTEEWEKVGDLPGPAFALNEFQAGVYQNGNILCIGFIDQVVKGILGFNMVKRTWSTYTGLPNSSSDILQLVENDGVLYLFTEHLGESNEQWIDRVELTQSGILKLVNVVKTEEKIGAWSLDVYSEFALLPYSKSQLCIFNTVGRTGEIHDVEDRARFEVLQAVPEQGFSGEVSLYILNPMSFTLEPRFDTKA